VQKVCVYTRNIKTTINVFATLTVTEHILAGPFIHHHVKLRWGELRVKVVWLKKVFCVQFLGQSLGILTNVIPDSPWPLLKNARIEA
jgi:hypothetical protein